MPNSCYILKKRFNCFLYTQASTSPHPPPTFTTLQYGSENMAINHRNNENEASLVFQRSVITSWRFYGLKGIKRFRIQEIKDRLRQKFWSFIQ